MRLQKSNNNDCLPYAFAMACDVEPNDFIQLLGKQGYNIAWPDLPNPKCYRGWHLQECMIVAYAHCKMCVPIYRNIVLGHDDEHLIYFEQEDFPCSETGVLILKDHAVAYHGDKIFDPKGKVYDYKNLMPEIKILIFDLI